MGKIIFGSFVTDIRGKVGGSVYTANAAGAFVRNRVTPVNPRTAAQVNVRARVSNLSQKWRNLTEAQRNAWAAATPNYPYKDSLGQTKTYTGQQLFMTLNSSIKAANPAAADITSPPTPGSVTQVLLTSLTPTATAGFLTALSLVFAPTVPTGQSLILYGTPGLSPGIMRPGASSFRQFAVIAAAATSPQAIFAAYSAVFGAVAAGNKIFIRAETVLLATGQRINGGQVSATV